MALLVVGAAQRLGPHRVLFSTVLILCLLAANVFAADSLSAEPDRQRTRDAEEAGVNVSVFYVTNRQRDAEKLAEDVYGGERGKPSFGSCEVAFRPIPVMDEVSRKVPFFVPSETREVRVAEQSDPHTFWRRLSAEVSQSSTRTVVLFVHGYNYGFGRGCRRAAEMQRELQGASTVVKFSWPSNASPTDYVPDVADVEWSVPFLASLLAELGKRFGKDNVHVLAHSLGSRGVIFALERLRADSGAKQAIGHLVLLAPDFDSETFADFLPRLSPLTRAVTLYASSNDAPLKVSRRLHGHPRLGEAGEFLRVVKGMETIDVSGVGRYQILGHEYFLYHPLVQADLVTLLTGQARAAERPGLRARTREGLVYWELKQLGAR